MMCYKTKSNQTNPTKLPTAQFASWTKMKLPPPKKKP